MGLKHLESASTGSGIGAVDACTPASGNLSHKFNDESAQSRAGAFAADLQLIPTPCAGLVVLWPYFPDIFCGIAQ